ncbi:hypothetical protein FIBSPDRAFT_463598 [Athelia psychrophila]|uniref:Uncharacterized protein n=1 Tax=Athelia psychrophila TaxID=1759441 RepID=A0A166LPN9_9AGAM|nr:hypothetical protein FIBSPDRAFT_463598 [Fibularhizoctonia sp. CBS 109695]
MSLVWFLAASGYSPAIQSFDVNRLYRHPVMPLAQGAARRAFEFLADLRAIIHRGELLSRRPRPREMRHSSGFYLDSGRPGLARRRDGALWGNNKAFRARLHRAWQLS